MCEGITTVIIKSKDVYSSIENTIGVVPGNFVEYRLYHNGEMLSTAKLLAVTIAPVVANDHYKLWMSMDERLMTPDVRSTIQCFAIDGVTDRDPNGYSFELEII